MRIEGHEIAECLHEKDHCLPATRLSRGIVFAHQTLDDLTQNAEQSSLARENWSQNPRDGEYILPVECQDPLNPFPLPTVVRRMVLSGLRKNGQKQVLARFFGIFSNAQQFPHGQPEQGFPAALNIIAYSDFTVSTAGLG